MQTVGTAMTKYVTGPIVAAGAASVAAFNEVDAGLDIIAKKTGATGDALTDMEERAKNLATSIPTDFNTAGEAIGEVNTRFGLTGQELEDLSGKFIKFADLNGTDVTSSIDSVQAAMAAMNVGTEAAGEFLDILNKAAQDTGTDVNKLTNDITANATALREMGMGYNTAVGFLANLNKQGVDASSVMAGLKTALKTATKNGQSMGEAMRGLMGKIKGARTETEAMQIASELFGSKSGPAMAQAIREGRLSFDDFANAVQDAGGSVDRTFEQTLDPIDEFKTALNELKIVGMDLVSAAAPMIKNVASGLKNMFSNLRKWWEGLSPLAQQTILKVTAIAAAVGPVLVVVGKITSAVGSIMTFAPQIVNIIGTVKTALSGLWAVLAANPITLVVAAIAGLVAAFIHFWKTSEAFRNFWKNLWAGIKDVVSNAATAIKSTWDKVTGWVKEKASSMWEGVKTVSEKVQDATKQVLSEKWANIKQAYEEHGGGLRGIAAATVEAIKAKYTAGFDIINNLLGGKLDGIKTVFRDVWEDIKSIVGNAIERIKNLFNFEWHLPKLKLPHFKLVGSFSLSPPSVPHLSVDWYKKAMQDGMILSTPTILPSASGQLRGFGDAGPEAVVGVDSLRSMITSAVNQRGYNRNLTVIMQIGKSEFARVVTPIIEAEQQRVGVSLATT